MKYYGTVANSQVAGAPEKYRVKLSDPCQKCEKTALAPHKVRGGLLNLQVTSFKIKCGECGYLQKDLSFLHMS